MPGQSDCPLGAVKRYRTDFKGGVGTTFGQRYSRESHSIANHRGCIGIVQDTDIPPIGTRQRQAVFRRGAGEGCSYPGGAPCAVDGAHQRREVGRIRHRRRNRGGGGAAQREADGAGRGNCAQGGAVRGGGGNADGGRVRVDGGGDGFGIGEGRVAKGRRGAAVDRGDRQACFVGDGVAAGKVGRCRLGGSHKRSSR